MSCMEAGYGSVLPDRKSSAMETMPWDAMYSWRKCSVVRSLLHQAPPWHSTSAGNGPSPRGVNTRANSGLSPWRRYSMSLTVYSAVLDSKVAVVMTKNLSCCHCFGGDGGVSGVAMPRGSFLVDM